jgi:hypothetical protein
MRGKLVEVGAKRGDDMGEMIGIDHRTKNPIRACLALYPILLQLLKFGTVA